MEKISIRILDIFHILFMEASDHLLFHCLLFLRFLYISDQGSSQLAPFISLLPKKNLVFYISSHGLERF